MSPRTGRPTSNKKTERLEIRLASERLRGDYLENQKTQKNYLLDSLSEEQKKQLAEMADRTEAGGQTDGAKR